jgi:hypothetical protein
VLRLTVKQSSTLGTLVKSLGFKMPPHTDYKCNSGAKGSKPETFPLRYAIPDDRVLRQSASRPVPIPKHAVTRPVIAPMELLKL